MATSSRTSAAAVGRRAIRSLDGAVAPALGLIIFALLLRLAGLGVRDLFRDEAASWLLSGYAPVDLVRHTATEAYPPLYPLLLKGWTAIWGNGEVAMRLLSVLAGMVMVLGAWRWATEALGERAGLLVLGLVAVAPMAVSDARNARMYALEEMFATLAWWFTWRLLHHPTTLPIRLRDQLLAAAFVAGECWTLAFGLPIAALQAVATALAWIQAHDDGARQRARSAAVSIVVGGALFLPWLPVLMRSAVSSASFWTGRPGSAAVPETFASMLVGTSPLPTAILGTSLVLALLAIGLDRLLRGRIPPLHRSDAQLLGTTLLLAIALVPLIWIGSYVHSVYDPRYFGAAVAPAAIAVGAGWMAVVPIVRRDGWRAWAVAAGGVVAAACVIAGSVVALTDALSGRGLAPSSAVIAYLRREVHAGDAVIAVDARSYFPLAYLAGRASPPDPLIVPIWYWRSPGEPAYDGGSLIPIDHSLASTLVNDPRWPWVIPGLQPGRHVWIVALANGDHEQIAFAPLHHSGLRETQRVLVKRTDEIAQIRRLDP